MDTRQQYDAIFYARLGNILGTEVILFLHKILETTEFLALFSNEGFDDALPIRIILFFLFNLYDRFLCNCQFTAYRALKKPNLPAKYNFYQQKMI